MARAVLFDLGNTLVGYYTASDFSVVLRQCLRECVKTRGWPDTVARDDELFERALMLNREQSDYAVRSLTTRLEELFGAYEPLDDASIETLVTSFLKPIFATARLDPQALPVLEDLRRLGIKTGIVSNTPWGSPASEWRRELARHGLLDRVDATVFCVDVGWRKPHRAPFDRALSLLDVAPADTLFVGDDRRWDVAGAEGAGLRPVLIGLHSPADPSAGCLTIRELRDIVALATDR